jgi:hypothetical protein
MAESNQLLLHVSTYWVLRKGMKLKAGSARDLESGWSAETGVGIGASFLASGWWIPSLGESSPTPAFFLRNLSSSMCTQGWK